MVSIALILISECVHCFTIANCHSLKKPMITRKPAVKMTTCGDLPKYLRKRARQW